MSDRTWRWWGEALKKSDARSAQWVVDQCFGRQVAPTQLRLAGWRMRLRPMQALCTVNQEAAQHMPGIFWL
jgi:hypothetical protein